MDLDELREAACAHLRLRLPPGNDPAQLVDECLSSARRSLRDEFILQLGPDAWAQIALAYVTAFLDTGNDVSVGEIFALVIRDSVHLKRLDILAQQAAQAKGEPAVGGRDAATKLTVVKP